MSPAVRLQLVALACLLGSACAPTLPSAHVQAHAAADRAYAAGRYEEAAGKYREASAAAERVKDRDEMLYLEAAAYARARRWEQAARCYRELIALSPGGLRTPRAAFELAGIEIDHGDVAKGWQMVEDALKKYPDSGVARPSLERVVRHIASDRGAQASLDWLRQNLSWLKKSDCGETASYLVADRLLEVGDVRGARDGFVQTAKDYPYPSGSLFDDSMFRASELDEKLGEPRVAVDRLRELLSHREPSSMNGSYERPRYGKAQMRIAELYRDALRDHATARKEFRKLFEQHTTSLLRDDALWQEALLARQDGDSAGACDAVGLLVKKLPESRHAPCARLLCPSAPELDKPRACRDYLARELAPATTSGNSVGP